jgi:hypothetical protein
VGLGILGVDLGSGSWDLRRWILGVDLGSGSWKWGLGSGSWEWILGVALGRESWEGILGARAWALFQLKSNEIFLEPHISLIFCTLASPMLLSVRFSSDRALISWGQ